MKLKLIAIFLLSAMLLTCLSGCAGVDWFNGTAEEGHTDQLVTGGTASLDIPAEERLLLSEVDSDGNARFQIIYKQGNATSQAYAEQISSAIEKATGVKIPVLHDLETSMSNKAYEIRIGQVTRTDATSSMSAWKNRLGEIDFLIEQTQPTVVHLYGKSTSAVKSAVTYFMDYMLVADEESGEAYIQNGFDTVEYIQPKETSIQYTGHDENYLYFTLNPGLLAQSFARISFAGNKAWRLQTKVAESDEFNDIGASQRLSLVLGEEPKNDVYPITVTEKDGIVTATEAGGSYVMLSTEPFALTFYTPNDTVASKITNIASTIGGSSLTGDILPNEAIFGTGERFDTVNQRGKKISMFTVDLWSSANACYMVIPLLCFTRGSGVFLNIYEEINLSLGSASKKAEADTWSAEIIGAAIDAYFYTSDQMSDAIYGYTELSGHAEMPEEWTYGMIICRYSDDLTQKWGTDISAGSSEKVGGREMMGVYDCIAMMEAYDLPWTGILAEAWGPDNQSKQDDLKELCDYVHSLGKKFLVYMRVGYIDQKQIGYSPSYALSMTNPDGTTTIKLPAASTNNPDTAGAADAYPYLDITNPAAVEWFFDEYWDYLSNDIGIDGCKIDFCETVPEYYELNYYDEDQPTSGSHHFLPTAFCAMFGEMISSKPDGGMSYTRGGGIGSQRAPYMWAGDQMRCYDSLSYQLTAVLSSGMSGVPFISYDMAGYQYGTAAFYQNPYYEGQVLVRGLQFSAFTICMQQHGNVRNVFEFANGDVKMEYVNGEWVKVTKKDANGVPILAKDANGDPIPAKDEFGNLKTDANGNQLYEYEYEYEIAPGQMTYITDIYRGYVKLHELLTPYITEYSKLASETGMPLMRPLALMWQDDTKVYSIDDEYMFGDAFLVAPVLDNTFSRDIYLPEGRWKDLNTGVTYNVGPEGKTLTNYAVALQELPVFYNLNTTSATAADLLPGIEEVFEYLAQIDCSSHKVYGSAS